MSKETVGSLLEYKKLKKCGIPSSYCAFSMFLVLYSSCIISFKNSPDLIK